MLDSSKKDQMEKLLLNGPQTMPQNKVQQLKIESAAWKRLLDFLREENVYSKNRLSDILKDGFENLLEDLENFHNRFVKQDEVISLLRNDIAELDKLLLNENISNDIECGVICRRLDNVRYNLSDSEGVFANCIWNSAGTYQKILID